MILFNNSFSVIDEGYTIFFDIIPIFSAVLILFLTYISLAEFSPIKITAIEGLRLLSLSDFKTYIHIITNINKQWTLYLY